MNLHRIVSILWGLLVMILLLNYMTSCSSSHKTTIARESMIASNIIANMRNIRTAFLEWYEDNHKTAAHTGSITAEFHEAISEYFAQYSSINFVHDRLNVHEGDYVITALSNDKMLYVGYKFSRSKDDDKVRKKLQMRARSAGLVNSDGKSPYEDDYEVYMRIVPKKN